MTIRNRLLFKTSYRPRNYSIDCFYALKPPLTFFGISSLVRRIYHLLFTFSISFPFSFKSHGLPDVLILPSTMTFPMWIFFLYFLIKNFFYFYYHRLFKSTIFNLRDKFRCNLLTLLLFRSLVVFIYDLGSIQSAPNLNAYLFSSPASLNSIICLSLFPNHFPPSGALFSNLSGFQPFFRLFVIKPIQSCLFFFRIGYYTKKNKKIRKCSYVHRSHLREKHHIVGRTFFIGYARLLTYNFQKLVIRKSSPIFARALS